MIAHASNQVQVEEVVKLAGAAFPNRPGLYLGHVNISQRKHTERLEELPRSRTLDKELSALGENRCSSRAAFFLQSVTRDKAACNGTGAVVSHSQKTQSENQRCFNTGCSKGKMGQL